MAALQQLDPATYARTRNHLVGAVTRLSPNIGHGVLKLAEVRATGYLHNHARMWMAAYIVHFRRVRWQARARWFLTHLLDGDPASNNLSWQWVVRTFGHKPYIFNRANLPP